MKQKCVLPVELLPDDLAVLYSQEEEASEVSNDKPCDSLEEAEQVTNVPSEGTEEQQTMEVTEAPTVGSEELNGCVSNDTQIDSQQNAGASNDDPCESASTGTEEELTNVFGTIYPFQPVSEPIYDTNKQVSPSILEFPTVSSPVIDDGKQPEPIVENGTDQSPIRLEFPREKWIEALWPKPAQNSYYYLFLRFELYKYKSLAEPDSDDMRNILQAVVLEHIEACGLKGCALSSEQILTMLNGSFEDIVAVIRETRGKVGVAELCIMVLLAAGVDDVHWLKKREFTSDAKFCSKFAQHMGISPSKARDYVKRGRLFLKYKEDILNGVGDVTGIPITKFASSYMAKFTLYEQAVNRLGREKALLSLKTLTFAEFQKAVTLVNTGDKKPKPKKEPSIADDLSPSHELFKSEILELNLKPNEKRLLRIIAKGGIWVSTPRILTEEEVEYIEKRLHEYRIGILESNYRSNCITKKQEQFDPEHPIVFCKELFEISDYNEIVLRIRAALALLQPMRRAIAILLFRLYYEKPKFGPIWKHPSVL